MSTGRAAVAHPLLIDMSALAAPPLKVLVQKTYRPSGIVQREPDGTTVASFPWYNEWAFRIGDDPDATFTVLYVLPNVLPSDRETNFLVACIGDSFDVFFEYLTGADYGDKLTGLVARHWPDVYRMLVDGQGPVVRSRILCGVRSSTKLQWAIAEPLDGLVPHRQAEDLLRTSLRVSLDALGFHLKLPGILDVLGGPDRTSRRLKALSSLFHNLADGGGLFEEGLDAKELIDLVETAGKVFEDLRAVKD